MLTNKQVAHLHEERNRIIAFTQELREMAGSENYFFHAICHSAADELMLGCMMIDDVLLEGSATDERQAG